MTYDVLSKKSVASFHCALNHLFYAKCFLQLHFFCNCVICSVLFCMLYVDTLAQAMPFGAILSF